MDIISLTNEAFKELTAVEDWFGLDRFLKIEEDELKEIERSHGRDDDRKLAMLRLWGRDTAKDSLLERPSLCGEEDASTPVAGSRHRGQVI